MNPIYHLLKHNNLSIVSVKNRLLAVFSFCCIVSSISSIFSNIYLKLPFETNIIVFLVIIIHAIAFYAAIRNLISNKGRFIYLTILITLLPFAWIYNGGIIGSIPMFYFVYLYVSILCLNRLYRNYFIVYIIILITISIYIQLYHSSLIIPYHSIEAQLFDMTLCFIQVIMTTILLTINYTSINYDIQAKLISHKEQLQASYAKLAVAKERADEATIAKTNFITNISHEIRTPLTGIIGITNLLATTPLDNNQKLLMHSLDTSSKTLLDLVNDLLDLSKIETNKLKLNNEIFTIRPAIEEIKNLMTLQLREKNIVLKMIVADNVPATIWIDKNKYKQILINLLSNAIKFTNTGSVVCKIIYDKTTSFLSTQVEDTGLGIEQKDYHKLFTPFTQLYRSTITQQNGIGIGLTISKKMVELMKGDISFISTVGIGSTFTFTIPIPPPTQTNTDKHKDHQIPVDNKKLHILIAEDHKINQMVLAKMVEKLQHTYDLADNGKEAVEMCKENTYDAILMDIQMPLLNGLEASKIILDYYNDKAEMGPKIIICSANVFQLNNEPELNAHISDFLIKPISLDQINTVLNKV